MHLYGPSPTKAILAPGSLSITLYFDQSKQIPNDMTKDTTCRQVAHERFNQIEMLILLKSNMICCVCAKLKGQAKVNYADLQKADNTGKIKSQEILSFSSNTNMIVH